MIAPLSQHLTGGHLPWARLKNSTYPDIQGESMPRDMTSPQSWLQL